MQQVSQNLEQTFMTINILRYISKQRPKQANRASSKVYFQYLLLCISMDSI